MEPTVSITQVILSLLLVIGLIGLFAYALKYLRAKPWFSLSPSGTPQLKVTDRLLLDAKTRLVVARWKERDYLILLHGSGAELLDTEEETHAG